MLGDEFSVALAGHLLDDETQEVIAGVAVGPALTRREFVGPVTERREEFGGGEIQRRAVGVC